MYALEGREALNRALGRLRKGTASCALGVHHFERDQVALLHHDRCVDTEDDARCGTGAESRPVAVDLDCSQIRELQRPADVVEPAGRIQELIGGLSQARLFTRVDDLDDTSQGRPHWQKQSCSVQIVSPPGGHCWHCLLLDKQQVHCASRLPFQQLPSVVAEVLAGEPPGVRLVLSTRIGGAEAACTALEGKIA